MNQDNQQPQEKALDDTGLDQNDKPMQNEAIPQVPSLSSTPTPVDDKGAASSNFTKPAPTDQTIPASMASYNSDPSLYAPETNQKESVPVVRVWSVRGVEYAIMSFMLWAVAIAVNWVVVALINGQAGFVELSPPLALMIVSLPAFSFFFLRLKKAELMKPELKTESTKRRFTQITQIVSFGVVFFSSLSIVASILSKIGGQEVDLPKIIGTALAFIVIWGGLFAYYWIDEHKQIA